MTLPDIVKQSGLYGRLCDDSELLQQVVALRSVTERLADTVARSVPAFTDHSIRHMDALWHVADRILTDSERSRLAPAEAFLLASGFYLHDIGMAYAATEEGAARCRASDKYQSFLASLGPHPPRDADARAIAFAVRQLHATAALELATEPVPGTNIRLFENDSFREAWGDTCGRVAQSHHWNLDEVDRQFGHGSMVPLPGGRSGDLGYVACVLRIVDFAHISRDRASTIDRAFRLPIARDSLVHWLAQEHIDGPEREGDTLLYRAARPVHDVDAWWLYYEMLRGLDEEIRSVRRYQERRPGRTERFSLQGVRGAGSPEEAAVFVPPGGFLPIEINLRTGSIERLVHLLAGESLYGPDPMAPVRELIQNARDAVLLKSATDLTDADRATLALPIRVALKRRDTDAALEVTDWGVGMSQKVMTDYLISIASDYWTSQFFFDFPRAMERGFRPAGKFGIGFLSVFMLGDEIIVESNRSANSRLQLTLRGIARRGELRDLGSASGSGTHVKIHLKEQIVDRLCNLGELVRAYAPMLSHPLTVEVDDNREDIEPEWLFRLSSADFRSWVLSAIETIVKNRDERAPHEGVVWRWRSSRSERLELWEGSWPEFTESSARLLACFDSISLLCLKGLALQPIATPGFVGVIDLESAAPDVSRRRALQVDVKDILERARSGTRLQVIEQLNSLATKGLLIDKLEFVEECAALYGPDVLRESSVPWVSQLCLPGSVALRSARDILTILSKSRSLFVAFGTGPWTAMRKWAAGDVPPPDDEIAVVLDSTRRSYLRYISGGEAKSGSLGQLWPEYRRATLFSSILRLAAEAWQATEGALAEQIGWQHEGQVVWGRLTRP